MSTVPYKRNYHPLIILFYTYGMLDHEQLAYIPKNTRNNWNKFKHDNYHCEDWVKPFLKNFEDIKDVYMQAHLRKTIVLLLSISKGYQNVLSSITQQKSLLKQNAGTIVNAIDKLVNVTNIKVERACKLFCVSKDWFYREKRKITCSLSTFKICFKQHPNQLTYEEVRHIEQVIFKSSNYGKPKTTLYYQALKDELIFCGKSTFFKYATALGYQRPKLVKKINKIGFRASCIFEWLHVDITYVPTLEDGMQKVAFVKDNFSKGLLHYKSTTGKADSNFISELFQETFDKFSLFEHEKPIHILSDGGSENKGQLLTWIKNIKAPPSVSKITARTEEFPFSNSMAESTHSIYKTEFMRKELSKTTHEHLINLARFFDYYNNERYPTELYGLSPSEVLKGKTPNKHHYKERILQARKDRILVNQNFNKCPVI